MFGKHDDDSLRTPLNVMTGIRPRRPIARIIPQGGSQADPIRLQEAQAQQPLSINAIQQQLDTLQKKAVHTISKWRRKAIAVHNAVTNLVEPSF